MTIPVKVESYQKSYPNVTSKHFVQVSAFTEWLRLHLRTFSLAQAIIFHTHATNKTFICGQWPRWNTAGFIKEWQTDHGEVQTLKLLWFHVSGNGSQNQFLFLVPADLLWHLGQDILAPWTATHVHPNYLDQQRFLPLQEITKDLC